MQAEAELRFQSRAKLSREGSLGQYDQHLTAYILGCRVPQTLGLELGLSASWLSPAWVLGAKRIRPEIPILFPAVLTLVKVPLPVLPVLPLATRWSSPRGDTVDSVSNCHRAASQCWHLAGSQDMVFHAPWGSPGDNPRGHLAC